MGRDEPPHEGRKEPVSEDPLLAAVLADPDSDAPRLAYADAADRRGDPRGELIRLQIEWRAAMQEEWGRVSIGPMWNRIQELLRQHRATWTAPVAGLVDQARILRGFIEGVEVDAAAFLAHADELFRRAPIRHLNLTGARAVADQLAASPHLSRMVSLDLTQNHLGDDAFRRLMTSPHLWRVRALYLGLNDLTHDAVEALAACKSLSELEYVSLSGNPVDDPVEVCWQDELSLRIIKESASLPPFGRELEARYGYQRWLHAPSRLPTWPLLASYI
jgi:uncharacterized protein (TIGR02996 family)